MSDLHAVPETPELQALHARLAEYSLGGHWQTREQNPDLVPYHWPWSVIYSCLMQSGEAVKLGGIDDAAKRRTVQLVNPSLTDRKATSRTLQMSIQLVKPGERAECHRHTAAALRFVVEGDGTGYTNVEGEEMLMEPGDLVLTPNWTWHDHFNPGRNNIVWLDVLDAHLTRYLDAGFHENYAEGPAQAIIKRDGYSKQRCGAIRPRTTSVGNAALPFAYKWRDTLKALKEVAAAGERDASAHRRTDHADHRLLGANDSSGRIDESTPTHEQHHLSRRTRTRHHFGREIKACNKRLRVERARLLLRAVVELASLQKHIDQRASDYFFGH